MNKTELVEAVAADTGVSKSDVGAVIDAMFATVCDRVSKGEKVAIPGMLTFEQVERKARTGFNPQTKEPMPIPAGRAVKVSAGAKLKAAGKV